MRSLWPTDAVGSASGPTVVIEEDMKRIDAQGAAEHTARQSISLRQFLTRRSLLGMTRAERAKLVDGQTAATRPIIAGVILSGAMILAITGLFEAAGVTPGIGYAWWVVELVAAAIAGCALATWHIVDWRPRLALILLSTVLLGVFLSIPLSGTGEQFATRTGLFQLLPIALLTMLARPISIALMVATMVGLAWVRVALLGNPPSGAALYWLYTATTIGFGLLMGGYVTDFAVSAYRLRSRLRRQAYTDELTGLLNRAGWNREADEAYGVATSRGQPLSLALFDIDWFKAVNDTHGHETGDRVLQMLGRVLGERASPDSFSARLGGEEFVVLLVGQPPEQVEGFVKRVRSEFKQAASEFGTCVSAGIAHRQPGEAMTAQLRRADAALYRAKAAGRNAVESGA